MSIFEKVVSNYYKADQYEKIKNASIGIAGVGGIGSNCASILVRCGFCNFTIADFDIVSPSNLNRQIYNQAHIGKLKVECLKDVLRSINPELSIAIFSNRVYEGNIQQIFGSCTILIEAFDCAESKAMLFSKFMHSNKILVGASGIGGYGSSEDIKVLRVLDNVFIVGDGVSEVNQDMLPYAPKVIVASAMMADVVLNSTLNGHTF